VLRFVLRARAWYAPPRCSVAPAFFGTDPFRRKGVSGHGPRPMLLQRALTMCANAAIASHAMAVEVTRATPWKSQRHLLSAVDMISHAYNGDADHLEFIEVNRGASA